MLVMCADIMPNWHPITLFYFGLSYPSKFPFLPAAHAIHPKKRTPIYLCLSEGWRAAAALRAAALLLLEVVFLLDCSGRSF
jgi:hypothetical protein